MQYPIIDLLEEVGGESVTGKNLFEQSAVELGGTKPRTADISLQPIQAGTYTMSWTMSGTASGMWGIGFYYESINVGPVNTNTGRLNLTDTSNRAYFYMSNADYSSGYTRILTNIQLELGTTATDYEPYFSITFPQLSADDIAHRLKLPMMKYYPHAVIEALQTVKNGETLTYEQYQVLQHYLTPLGIGGI